MSYKETDYSSLFLLVCIDIKLTTTSHGSDVSWDMVQVGLVSETGSCSSANFYTDYEEYLETCCLTPGDYMLTCKDSHGDGWDGGFIEIRGHRYCDYLIDSMEMVPIRIAGTDTHVKGLFERQL